MIRTTMLRFSSHKRVYALPIIAFTLFIAIQPLEAQSRTFTEWATPTPNSEPLHVVPVPGHNAIFFSERTASNIGLLNQGTNTITEWALPNGGPHGIVLLGNNPTFCEQSGSKIGRLNPQTNVVTEWATPTANSAPDHLVTVGTLVFFAESAGNNIGMLNLLTNQITEWPIPTSNAVPNGIAAAGNGTQIWFAEQVGNVGMLNLTNNTITEWTPPLSAPIEIDHVKTLGGVAYFSNGFSSVIGSINPANNLVMEWTAPTSNAEVADLVVTPGLVSFTELLGNKIGILKTSAPSSNSTVVPTVTVVTPITSSVVPTRTTLARTTTVEAPTVTKVTGVATDGFVEWAVPTPGGDPEGIELLGSGVAFAERFGSKIGILK